MNCGSSKPKYLDQGKKALEGLRDTNSMKVGIQLGEYKLAFDEKMGDWKSFLVNFSKFKR